MDIPEEIREVTDALPNRDLVPEEVDRVGGALDGDAISSVTYEDDSGEKAVAIVNIWWDGEPTELGGILKRVTQSGEWNVTNPVRCPFSIWADSLEQASEEMGGEMTGGTKIVEMENGGSIASRVQREF